MKPLVPHLDDFFREPAAFGRLCVETFWRIKMTEMVKPAAFGRLCVETLNVENEMVSPATSRLRAAVC